MRIGTVRRPPRGVPLPEGRHTIVGDRWGNTWQIATRISMGRKGEESDGFD